MSTNFFNRPLIPNVPNPEPPTTPLLRDMLFRRIMLMEQDPYGGQTFSNTGRGNFNPYSGGYGSGGGAPASPGSNSQPSPSSSPAMSAIMAKLQSGAAGQSPVGHDACPHPHHYDGSCASSKMGYDGWTPSSYGDKGSYGSTPTFESTYDVENRFNTLGAGSRVGGIPAGASPLAPPTAPPPPSAQSPNWTPSSAGDRGSYGSTPMNWNTNDVENWFAGAGPRPGGGPPAGGVTAGAPMSAPTHDAAPRYAAVGPLESMPPGVGPGGPVPPYTPPPTGGVPGGWGPPLTGMPPMRGGGIGRTPGYAGMPRPMHGPPPPLMRMMLARGISPRPRYAAAAPGGGWEGGRAGGGGAAGQGTKGGGGAGPPGPPEPPEPPAPPPPGPDPGAPGPTGPDPGIPTGPAPPPPAPTPAPEPPAPRGPSPFAPPWMPQAPAPFDPLGPAPSTPGPAAPPPWDGWGPQPRFPGGSMGGKK